MMPGVSHAQRPPRQRLRSNGHGVSEWETSVRVGKWEVSTTGNECKIAESPSEFHVHDGDHPSLSVVATTHQAAFAAFF
jgi:hypothetical protein